MLQFNTVICTATTKFTSRLWGRLNIALTTSATPLPIESTNSVKKIQEKHLNIENTISAQYIDFNEFKKKLCSSFNMESSVVIKIKDTKNIQDLMEVTNTLLSKNDIIKINEAIAIWVQQNNETKGNLNHSNSSSQEQTEQTEPNAPSIIANGDFSMYSDLSTSAMVNEIKKLAHRSQRNVPLLKYLFQNILRYNKILSPEECSSLLLSMSKLSLPDERLLHKVCTDLLQTKEIIDSLSVTKLMNIVKSMAYIKHKNNNILQSVCNCIDKLGANCYPRHIITILISLAILGYEGEHVNNLIKTYLHYDSITKLSDIERLNFIWSLVIFNKASISQIQAVLYPNYIQRLMSIDPRQNVSHSLKLLNINGYARSILKDYPGPFLPSTVNPLTQKQTVQKELYIRVLEETLKNIVPSCSHYKINVNTEMGFLLDAEVYMDSNSRPVCVNDIKDYHTKIAIMIHDYHDVCVGSIEPHGLIKLQHRLLKSKNYEILSIPYTHFGIEDTLERRVTYLKRQLWKKQNK
ncbi:FAST kinase domain-containing protein 4 isoform X1 [Osmia lignaria lignaria]|uniref:FAST kinase domain-containing protein 4 isoform X1 n=3 Tax=Osmia lignaria lignaria TaxID=1437193 RepID=UPI0014782E1F|nr:FAST kinase domain-containing protein 4 isoform X1 [Osmia lignaria]XP_034187275.1 FAST kinase domain-containing protein 4 isoform X1 [Osmia lignaria]